MSVFDQNARIEQADFRQRFSAPLTPTIRRYLDIPNPGGGPSKAKAATRPGPPAHRPISAVSSESLNTAGPSSKPQHQRVQALASRPVRTAPVPEPTAEVDAGPSQKRLSPCKEPEKVFVPVKAESARPTLSKSASVGPGQVSEAPIALGRHGRSVSHNILPSTTISSSGPSSPTEFSRHNPLTKPSRPHLPSSLSSISLPADPSDTANVKPPRRFAPPTRIVRPAPLPSTNEDGTTEGPGDYFAHTPSGNTVLCGPQRLAPGGQSDRWVAVGFGKRPVALGPAQRRAVTAPEGMAIPLQTPGLANRVLGRSAKDRIKEMEEESEPTESSTSLESIASRATSPPPLPPPVLNPIDSPLMPVLARSVTTTAASSASSVTVVEDPMEQLLKVEQDVADVTVIAGGAGASVEAVESANMVNITPTQAQMDSMEQRLALVIAIPLPEDEDIPASGTTGFASASEVVTHLVDGESLPTAAPLTPAVPPLETLPYPVGTREADMGLAEAEKPAVLDKASVELPTVAIDVPHVAGVPPKDVSISASAQPAKPQLPKVELAREHTRKLAPIAMVRTISGPVDRKPFKPTARPVVAAVAPLKPSAAPGGALKTTVIPLASTKPPPTAAPPVAKPVARNSASSVQAASKPPATSGMIAPSVPQAKPIVKLAVSSTVGVTKPTASTAAKASTKLEPPKASAKTTSQLIKPVHAQVTLPPVRKEKVRLKAPLPSFVPTRGKAKATIAASTSSTSSQAERRTIVAKVRPEAIPLPLSPAERAKLLPADIPLPRSPVLTVSLRGATPGETSSVDSPVMGLAVSKPLSPVLPISNLAPVESPAIPQGKFISPSLNAMRLPADRFTSTSNRYASTAPPMSSDGEDDDTTGVTFKASTAFHEDRSILSWVRTDQSITTGDLMNFSVASRPAQAPRSDVSTPANSAEVVLAKLIGGTTPKGTPRVERIALRVRDANLSSLADA